MSPDPKQAEPKKMDSNTTSSSGGGGSDPKYPQQQGINPKKEAAAASGSSSTATAVHPTAPNKKAKSTKTTNNAASKTSSSSSVEDVLYHLTNGLPVAEMRVIMDEASKCEAELLKDISILEQALGNSQKTKNNSSQEEGLLVNETSLSIILESPLTPMDRYWTASALVGRLRDDLAVPSILTITQPDSPLPPAAMTTVSPRNKTSNSNPSNGNNDDPLDFTKHANYTKKESPTLLMEVWKKISAHRSSAVFKRAVKPEEAPGYAERISFPMDLGLIRKMIVAKQIESYADLQKYIGLISHNCVKYNGRETDYGRVAREFEAVSEEALRQAVSSTGTTPLAAARTPSTTSMGREAPTPPPAIKVTTATATTAAPIATTSTTIISQPPSTKSK